MSNVPQTLTVFPKSEVQKFGEKNNSFPDKMVQKQAEIMLLVSEIP